MKGFFGGLQTAPIAEIASGYGLEVLGPHVRRQEVDKRCLENVFLRFLVLVAADIGTKALGERQFVFCRDLMNEYALVQAGSGNKPTGLSAMCISWEDLQSE
jgi:hypothetical protein